LGGPQPMVEFDLPDAARTSIESEDLVIPKRPLQAHPNYVHKSKPRFQWTFGGKRRFRLAPGSYIYSVTVIGCQSKSGKFQVTGSKPVVIRENPKCLDD